MGQAYARLAQQIPEPVFLIVTLSQINRLWNILMAQAAKRPGLPPLRSELLRLLMRAVRLRSYASDVAACRGEVGFSAGFTHRYKGDFAITAGATYAGVTFGFRAEAERRPE